MSKHPLMTVCDGIPAAFDWLNRGFQFRLYKGLGLCRLTRPIAILWNQTLRARSVMPLVSDCISESQRNHAAVLYTLAICAVEGAVGGIRLQYSVARKTIYGICQYPQDGAIHMYGTEAA